MGKERFIKNQVFIFFILVVCTSVSVGMHFLNSPYTNYSNVEYYHLRLASNPPIYGIDALQEGITYAYTPYHAVLFSATRFLPMQTSVFFIGFITSIVCAIFIFKLLERLGISLDRAFAASIVVVVSPAFTGVFGSIVPGGLAFLLAILAGLLLQGSPTLFRVVGALAVAIIVPLFGPVHALGIIAILVLVAVMERTKSARFVAGVVIFQSGVLLLLGYFASKAWMTIPAQIPIGIFAELGYERGIGIFVFLTASVGMYTLWKRRSELWTAYVLAFILLIFVFMYSASTSLYLLLVLAIFSSAGIFRLIESKWEIEILKHLTIVLIVCGLLFTMLSSVSSVDNPDDSLSQGARFLRGSTPGSVLTLPIYGHTLQYLSHQQVYATTIDEKDAIELLMQRNPAILQEKFLSKNITYVLIDNSMREKVWGGRETGILFALRAQELFKREYNQDGVEIWRVIP